MIKRERAFTYLINKNRYKICAEIGVYKGYFSRYLLDHTKLEQLYCIDVWKNNDIFNEASQVLFDNRVTMLKTNSEKALSWIPNNSLDFVYIDGAHDLEGIYEDIHNWIHKVRIKGVIAGHDYKDSFKSSTFDVNGKLLPNRVKVVVDDFVQRYGFNLQITQEACKSWWFFKDHEIKKELKLNF